MNSIYYAYCVYIAFDNGMWSNYKTDTLKSFNMDEHAN